MRRFVPGGFTAYPGTNFQDHRGRMYRGTKTGVFRLLPFRTINDEYTLLNNEAALLFQLKTNYQRKCLQVIAVFVA